MSGWAMFFMFLGAAYAATLPFKIVDKLEGRG